LNDQVKEDEMGRAYSTNGKNTNVCKTFLWESQRKDNTKKRRRGVDSIEIDLREIGCSCVDSIDLAQDKDSGGFL
jgi:hypothetical protein